MSKYLNDKSDPLRGSLIVQEAAADFNLRLVQILKNAQPHLRVIEDESKLSKVLAFPRLNDFAVYLSQELISSQKCGLAAFLVGPSLSKRLVICDEMLIQKKLLDDCNKALLPTKATSQNVADEEFCKRNDSSDSSVDTNVLAIESVETLGITQPPPDEVWFPLETSHLTELLNIVGPVEIIKPRWEDFGYDMEISLDESAIGHILEVYDFAPELKTSDLEKILIEFKDRFNIVWVDDTHALLVFNDLTAASEILTFRHPLLKVRPLLIASRNSKLKVTQSQSAYKFLPPKPRPQTLPTAARRMISSSLGIRQSPNTRTKEEEEILRHARAERTRGGTDRKSSSRR